MPPSQPKKVALLIGINYKNTAHELRGCINDAKSMQSLLQDNGYSCTMMLDDAKTTKSLQPTRKNLLREMRALVKNTRRGDKLFLHYSGHGTYTRDRSHDEIDGRDEAICPVDGSVITDDELRQILVQRLPSGVQMLCLLDCCHSGTGADLRFNYEVRQRAPRRNAFHYNPRSYRLDSRTNDKQPSTEASIVCISGCRDHQTSADTYMNNQACGAMSDAFLEAWTCSATSETDVGPCSAPLHDIIQYMSGMLSCYGYEQIPQLSLSNNDDHQRLLQKTMHVCL